MTRKTTKRKVYARIDTLKHATEGAAVSAAAMSNKLRLMELSAIESFRTGVATMEDMRIVNGLVNLTAVMVKEGRKGGDIATCERAESALEAAYDRLQSHGRLAVDGPGLNAMRELYQLHDELRGVMSRQQYEGHIKRATNIEIDTARKARKGQIAPGVRVLTIAEPSVAASN